MNLDLGTTTGWAVAASGLITSGTTSFRPSRYDGGGVRYLRFRHWLDLLIDHDDHLDAVYFEEIRRHAGTDAAHVYGGFLAYLTAWCEERDVPYQGVPVGTIKRHVTSKGNPRNNTAAIDAVKASIAEFGFRQPIVVDEKMVVIVGHTRLEAAKALGLKTVPVHIAEGLTPAQARAYRLMDNRSHENAEWDDELLRLEFGDLTLWGSSKPAAKHMPTSSPRSLRRPRAD